MARRAAPPGHPSGAGLDPAAGCPGSTAPGPPRTLARGGRRHGHRGGAGQPGPGRSLRRSGGRRLEGLGQRAVAGPPLRRADAGPHARLRGGRGGGAGPGDRRQRQHPRRRQRSDAAAAPVSRSPSAGDDLGDPSRVPGRRFLHVGPGPRGLGASSRTAGDPHRLHGSLHDPGGRRMAGATRRRRCLAPVLRRRRVGTRAGTRPGTRRFRPGAVGGGRPEPRSLATAVRGRPADPR